MKDNYLLELKALLDDYDMDKLDKDDIISDYSDMYDSWIDKGFSDEETLDKLGSPKSIIRDLTEEYKKIVKPQSGSQKLIALMPFISLGIFFILGFGYDLWHPGWMVFLLIPVVAIVLEMGSKKNPHLFTALSPFFATFVFLYLGIAHDLWHPAWIVFLMTPILGIWNSRFHMSKISLVNSLLPFAATIAYAILGLNGYWVEGWVVFLLIPMVGMLNNKNKYEMMIWEILCIGGIAGYLYIGIVFSSHWQYAWLSFAPVVIYSLFLDEVDFNVIIFDKDASLPLKMAIIGALILFASFGIIGYWGISWLFLLLIPVIAILTEAPKKDRLVAITPFIALVIFFTLGYFFDLWHLSWMAFLMIPVIAIIKNA